MQAIILAGGKGTRLKSLSNSTPKLLMPFSDKPLIDHLIIYLKKNGIDNIIICTGHLADGIEEYINRSNYDIQIKLSRESKPLGTAGALHLIKDFLENEFFVLYGDVYTTINLQKMFKFHKKKKADVTMALHKSDHSQDSTVVRTDKNNKLLSLVEKPGYRWGKYGNLTTTPLYIFKKDLINFIVKNKTIDFAKDVFPKLLKRNKKLFGYITKEYAKDIGTPKRYKEVQRYITITKNFLL